MPCDIFLQKKTTPKKSSIKQRLAKMLSKVRHIPPHNNTNDTIGRVYVYMSKLDIVYVHIWSQIVTSYERNQNLGNFLVRAKINYQLAKHHAYLCASAITKLLTLSSSPSHSLTYSYLLFDLCWCIFSCFYNYFFRLTFERIIVSYWQLMCLISCHFTWAVNVDKSHIKKSSVLEIQPITSQKKYL